MEKDVKKLVFTIVYGVVLALTFIGAFQLLYNAVPMIIYSSSKYFYSNYQLPFAIIILLVALFAIAFVVLEIVTICTKKEGNKKKYFITNMVLMALIVVTIIVCKVFFMTKYYKYHQELLHQFPHGIYNNNQEFVLFQSTMALLVSQLIYVATIGAMRIAQRICAKKKKLVEEENIEDNAIKE